MLSHPDPVQWHKSSAQQPKKSRTDRNLTEQGEKAAKKSPPGITDVHTSWQGSSHMFKLHLLMGKKNRG